MFNYLLHINTFVHWHWLGTHAGQWHLKESERLDLNCLQWNNCILLYFLVPHRFRLESTGIHRNGTRICRNGTRICRNPLEWHRNPQEWHQNSTGIGILEVYYDMQVYISVVWCYLVIHNTITQLHTSVCY
jgi:hypothetical protein